ncbi:MAG TPA: hypothetical protein VKV79_06805 [Terriglobia bacterium]|nr:hypothetical protein [Terriglobia bacterium]
MKLSFLPGKLFLDSTDDGYLRIALNGEEIFQHVLRRPPSRGATPYGTK